MTLKQRKALFSGSFLNIKEIKEKKKKRKKRKKKKEKRKFVYANFRKKQIGLMNPFNIKLSDFLQVYYTPTSKKVYYFLLIF